MDVRKYVTVVEEIHTQMGRKDDGGPLKKVVVAAVVKNPYAGEYVEDLQPLIDASVGIAEEMCRRATAAAGGEPFESYGKAGMVGTNGDQEHVNAMLTSAFGDVLRKACGGGAAWISSVTKRCAPGANIDVPLAYKDAVYVRSHYDAIAFHIEDAPAPDEIVLIAAFATRGRINARVGGLKKEEAVGDGVR